MAPEPRPQQPKPPPSRSELPPFGRAPEWRSESSMVNHFPRKQYLLATMQIGRSRHQTPKPSPESTPAERAPHLTPPPSLRPQGNSSAPARSRIGVAARH